jgi:hypothetical protein
VTYGAFRAAEPFPLVTSTRKVRAVSVDAHPFTFAASLLDLIQERRAFAFFAGQIDLTPRSTDFHRGRRGPQPPCEAGNKTTCCMREVRTKSRARGTLVRQA